MLVFREKITHRERTDSTFNVLSLSNFALSLWQFVTSRFPVTFADVVLCETKRD